MNISSPGLSPTLQTHRSSRLRSPFGCPIGSSDWTGTRLSSSSSLKPAPPEDFQLSLGEIHPSSSPRVHPVLCLSATPHIQLRNKPSYGLNWPLIRATAIDSKLILFLPLPTSAYDPVKTSIHHSIPLLKTSSGFQLSHLSSAVCQPARWIQPLSETSKELPVKAQNPEKL